MLFFTPLRLSHLLFDRSLRSKALTAPQYIKQVWRHDNIAVDVSVVIRVHELACAIEHVRSERHVEGVHSVVALAVDAERCAEADDDGAVCKHNGTKRVGALEQLEHVERIFDAFRQLLGET